MNLLSEHYITLHLNITLLSEQFITSEHYLGSLNIVDAELLHLKLTFHQ